MIGLIVILAFVLVLPFTFKMVEQNLEIFLFYMGIAAAFVSGMMNKELIIKALIDPIIITIAVFVAGLLTKWLRSQLERIILSASRALTPKIFLALTIIVLGLASSIITAIIAAIILVNIINIVGLERQSEIRVIIIACFAIGLGAALTPIGEPLSTITVSKLNESFTYLLILIGPLVIPGVTIFGILTFFFAKPQQKHLHANFSRQSESYEEIFIRAIKIYLFVMGLTYLGHGFEPLINAYILGLHPMLLYWINMTSAVLDNATLAAAEISPAMDETVIRAILMGLLISGGMLIPGNIPNIIAAGKLNITSKEWAQFGVPFGLIVMIIYFFIMFFI